MVKYIINRLLLLIPVLIGVTFIVFLIMALRPGNPAEIILGEGATHEAVAQLSKEMGLDQPLLIRYINYMLNFMRGSLGVSYKNELDVMSQIMDKFPNTLILALSSVAVSIVIGLPAGIISAKKQYSWIDNLSMGLALIGISMPVFWLGLTLVMIFSLKLGWLPSFSMGQGGVELLKTLILPSLTLGMSSAATIARMTRASMLEVIKQDYVVLAKAKGISSRALTYRHMLKNALIPIITVVGLQFGHLLGGSVITETVFSWPGVGRMIVDSIKMQDMPMVLGGVIFLSVMFSIVNLIVDILYAFVDPRIRYS